MAAGFTTALGLDRPELEKAIISVLEHDNADSSFVITCIMWEWLVGRSTRNSRASGALLPKLAEANSGVLLVTCHHTLSHYRMQGLKLGLNLNSYQQKDMFESLELLKITNDFLQSSSCVKSDVLDDNGNVVVQNLYSSIRKSVIKMSKAFKSVCLVVGNINDILNIGATMSDVIVFLNYLQGLVLEFEGLSLVVSVHVSTHNEHEGMLGAFLKHASNLTVAVSSLQTGLCRDISGSMTVVNDFSPCCLYHFCLLDRQVKIFAPGASGI